MSNACRFCRGFLLPVLLLAGAVVALSVDIPVAKAIRHWHANPTVHAYLGYLDDFEPFGHGLGLVVVLVALLNSIPARRWAIPRVAAVPWRRAAAADLLKMIVLRIRPYDLPATLKPCGRRSDIGCPC